MSEFVVLTLFESANLTTGGCSRWNFYRPNHMYTEAASSLWKGFDVTEFQHLADIKSNT